jgi:hypothetical protein
VARQQQNGHIDQNDYDLGPDVDEAAPYQGSQPANFAPAQQRPSNQIPTIRAVPPQGPDGRFLKTDQRHPLQQGGYESRQQQQAQQPYDLEQGVDESQVQTFEHPRGLLRRAYEVGMSDQEIDTTPTEQLEDMVWRRYGEATANARMNTNSQAVQPPQPVQQQALPPERPQLDPDEEINFGEFEEVMDKGFVKTLKDKFKKTLTRLKEHETRLVELDNREKKRQQEAEQRNRAQAHATYMDKLFAKHAQFLGDERWQELTPADPNALKRDAVLRLAQADQSRRSDQAKIDAAVGIMFGVQQRAPGQQRQAPRTARQQQWDEAGLNRPTQRRAAPEVNGVRKAIANVTGYLDQMGADAGSNGAADYEDFLGGEN